MSLTAISYVFAPVNTGGYGSTGFYYGNSTDAVTNGFYINELVFYAFNSAQIYAAEKGLVAPIVTVNFTLSNSDLSTQTVNVNDFFLQSDAQTEVDADQSNENGYTIGGSHATVYTLLSQGTAAQVNVKDQSVASSVDITTVVTSANTPGTPTGTRSGSGLPTEIPETYVSFAPSGTEGGLTYVSNVSAILTGYIATGAPTISGTVSNQTVNLESQFTPFAHVVLTDPGNPSGAGDDIQIEIIQTNGPNPEGTDIGGYLTGTGLVSYGDGDYQLTATTSVVALQQELDSLVLHTGLSGGLDSFAIDLDFQAGDGNTVDNQLTTYTINNAVRPACYVRGSRLLTSGGEKLVETLAIGDLMVTAAGERRPVRWIGCRSYVGRFLRANPGIQPIRFRAGSLGEDLPHRDLLVSPEHAMFLDGMLIPARFLVNGSTITQERGLDRVDYFHVELDSHDVLLAEGTPSESYASDGDSDRFHNVADRPAGLEQVVLCAPRVESGPALEATRIRLAGATLAA